MFYTAVAETDVGIVKKTNQDSVLIKHGKYKGKEVLLAVICDGMGGLAEGEIASATVVDEFSKWFDSQLINELNNTDMNVIGNEFSIMLKELNIRISEYAKSRGIRMGTTFTGVLFIDDYFVTVHVGDSRLYYINNRVDQLTEDQTFVAREIKRGNMTIEQAKTDKRRNMLLQCVGASDNLEPDVFTGKVQAGTYMLCSDGFRHELTQNEIRINFDSNILSDKNVMHVNARKLIETVKSRNEKDNISVILIKVIV